MPAGKSADLICRNTPELYARYMRENPLYFAGLFRVPLSERNLKKAVETMFPGRPFETGRKGNMGSPKVGTCSNCNRGPMTLACGLCFSCRRAAGSLTGEARAIKLAYVKEKIDQGEIKPRGKNAAMLKVQGKTPVAPDRGATETKSLRLGTGDVVGDRFARLRRMVEAIEALGCQATISLSISIEARP